MGSMMGGLTGTAGGASGTGFAAPQSVNLQQGVTPGQVNTSTGAANNALAQQNALVTALQKQNGVSNQTAAAAQQGVLSTGLAGNGGVSNQNQVFGQQQALQNALAGANGVNSQNTAIQGLQGVAGSQANLLAQQQGIVNGTGPNPAMAQLNATTGQNVANQAALMAGQRGSAQNVGLMARQAAQQGAATQQQAVGQGATMEAQQQLAAMQQMGAQQQAMAGTQQAIGGLGTTQVGQLQGQQQLAGATAQNQIANQLQSNQLGANIAAQQVGQQIGATQAATQAAQNEQGQLLSGLGAYNQAQVGMQGNVNQANAGLANTQMQGQQALIGGGLNALGSALAPPSMAQGGPVPPVRMADGGSANIQPSSVPGPVSSFVQFLNSVQPSGMPNIPQGFESFGPNTGAAALESGVSKVATPPKVSSGGATGASAETPAGAGAASGGLGEGMGAATPSAGAPSLMEGIGPAAALAMSNGGLSASGGGVKARTPEQEAVKSGNSYDNDKVPAMLSEGEIVLPRTVTQSANPVAAAAKFVQAIMSRKGKK